MLLEELAKEMVEVTSALVGGRTINIMNTDGVILASTEHERVGSFHSGAREAVRTGKAVNIRRDQLEYYPGAKEGCNMPLRVNGAIIGVVGVYGNPEEIQDVAHLLEGYATKYYQVEAMLRPRLSERVMRSQLLLNLLSPPNGTMTEANGLMEMLNIRFQYPVYTLVISSSDGLQLTEQVERLCVLLEKMGFLERSCDVWGVMDQRMILLSSHQEGRNIDELQKLQKEGYRISLGDPGNSLWDIQFAYHQASLLDLSSEEDFNDIRRTETRCRYILGHTAREQEDFLGSLAETLQTAFGQEDGHILLDSIKTYYDCGRSVSAAAQRLFIHKNTLQYRVRRVLEVLEFTRLPAFQQEYLVRLLLEHTNRKLRS